MQPSENHHESPFKTLGLVIYTGRSRVYYGMIFMILKMAAFHTPTGALAHLEDSQKGPAFSFELKMQV